ncbi:MAG: glutamine--tRNA ligase/YqeY domain fusion protein, partial [Thermoplasmatota archaeon]
MAEDERQTKDFIREIIDSDNRTGKHGGRVHTRFPPEPNGYLHIGHAKSICLNFGIAEEYGGKCNLRFDDTNPTKEEEEYVEAIKEDVRWLGFDWEDRLFFASDYFQQLYDWAMELVKKGKAYVDEQPAELISEQRGNLTTHGLESPFRDRPISENIDLFERMRKGEFKDGEKVLRAKIDMSHPNMNMRDPVMYRILHKTHHNTGDKWCIYPMYDWAHGLEDSIEKITHSLCTLEFENHRPLYDWFIDQLDDVYHPQQIEFARLNLSHTVMSKRKLLDLVQKRYVNGWDDPRLPTISGMRRRGYTPEAIRDFCSRIGVAKVNSTIAFELLEHCVRVDLNKRACRFMGVLEPLKVTIENFPDDETEYMEVNNNPEDPDAGTRRVPFTKHIYIEMKDFMEDPPKKFFRLSPGREVRLRNAYLVTCTDVIKEGDEIKEIICKRDPDSKGGDAPDGRKVKGTLHWVSVDHCKDAEVRLYDKL